MFLCGQAEFQIFRKKDAGTRSTWFLLSFFLPDHEIMYQEKETRHGLLGESDPGWHWLEQLFTVWHERRWFITNKQKRSMSHCSTCWSYCLDWLESPEQIHPRSSLRKYLNGTKLTCQEKTYKMRRTGEAGWQRVNFQNKSQEVVFSSMYF